MQTYTVKQLSDLAGVSRRTLHFYDQIGLLRPDRVQANGYRVYGRDALLRLQQIMFYKEMELSLEEIKRILDEPGFDTLRSLEAHRRALQHRKGRLDRLIGTIDHTISALKGETKMEQKSLFSGFSSPEEEEKYTEEAAQLWGEEVRRSNKLWKSYSAEKKQQIGAEGDALHRQILEHMSEGPAGPTVQDGVRRWREHMSYFWEPNIEQMRGLGRMYNDDPRFHATFAKVHPDYPAFLAEAIAIYCDRLEGK